MSLACTWLKFRKLSFLSGHIKRRKHHSLLWGLSQLLGIPRPNSKSSSQLSKNPLPLHTPKAPDSPVFFPPCKWVEVTEKPIFAPCEEAPSFGHNAHTLILFQKPPWKPTHDLTTENPCLRSWAFSGQIWEVLRDTEQLRIMFPGAFTWKQIDSAYLMWCEKPVARDMIFNFGRSKYSFRLLNQKKGMEESEEEKNEKVKGIEWRRREKREMEKGSEFCFKTRWEFYF